MPNEIPILGTLERIDLRQVWTHEARSFTPWLAQPSNLMLLAEAIGLSALELIQTEQSVEEFSADIVARVPDTGDVVLIDNQLDRSDHSHLGQLLSYAAGTEAKVIVWIALAFAEGHRAALEWLNNSTNDDLSFFAVEVQAWRIGNSQPAPRFNVIVKPNEWVRNVRASVRANSDFYNENIVYWAAFHEHLILGNLPHRDSTSPIRGGNYYLTLPNRPWVVASAYISRTGSYIGAYIRLSVRTTTVNVAEIFDRLKAEKANLDSETGLDLSFEQSSNGQRFYISNVKLPNANIENREDWSRQHEWLGAVLSKLYFCFDKHIPQSLPENGA